MYVDDAEYEAMVSAMDRMVRHSKALLALLDQVLDAQDAVHPHPTNDPTWNPGWVDRLIADIQDGRP